MFKLYLGNVQKKLSVRMTDVTMPLVCRTTGSSVQPRFTLVRVEHCIRFTQEWHCIQGLCSAIWIWTIHFVWLKSHCIRTKMVPDPFFTRHLNCIAWMVTPMQCDSDNQTALCDLFWGVVNLTLTPAADPMDIVQL